MSTERESIQSTGPAGVGGWLAFLVLGMIVLGPLLGLGRLAGDIASAERQYPKLIGLEDWQTFKTATWFAFACFALLSMYGGIALRGDHRWVVVKRAIAILWLVGPGSAVVMAWFIPVLIFGNAGTMEAHSVGTLLGSIIVASLWTAYLLRSKRVSRTYSKDETAAAPFTSSDLTAVVAASVATLTAEQPVRVSSSAATVVKPGVSEKHWAAALAELEGPARRPGVWAAAYAHVMGDEAKAKANYLKARATELFDEELAGNERARLAADQQLGRVTGRCPCCEKTISTSLLACPHCRASFGPGSAYKLVPFLA